MYEDLIITFHQNSLGVQATVWRRNFPEGRQRRTFVQAYTLELDSAHPSPDELLQALREALRRRPDYTV